MAWAGAVALGLATPLFVYGVEFWDHSLAALLSAAALALMVATGLLLYLGCLQALGVASARILLRAIREGF